MGFRRKKDVEWHRWLQLHESKLRSIDRLLPAVYETRHSWWYFCAHASLDDPIAGMSIFRWTDLPTESAKRLFAFLQTPESLCPEGATILVQMKNFFSNSKASS